MPAVPYEGVPQVSPDSRPPDDYQRIDANPRAFGASIAQGVEKLGQGTEQASENFFNTAKFQGKVNVDYGINNFIDAKNGIVDKFTNLQGADAADQQEDHVRQLKEAREQIRDGLKTPFEKLEFETASRRMSAEAESHMTIHAAQQRKVWSAGVQGEAANHSLNSYVNSPDGSEEQKHHGADFVNFRLRQAQLKFGFDPEIEKFTIESANQELLKARIDRVAAAPGGAAKAMAILKENSKIAGTQYDDMYGGLRAKYVAQTGDAVATESIAKARVGGFAPSVNSAIQRVAARHGIDPNDLAAYVQIESGGNPYAHTGSYKGIMQVSTPEFANHGPPGGNIWNAEDNLEAGAAKMKAEGDVFERNFGRKPSAFDIYMQHQQGVAGYAMHLANPNAPAWQNMLATGEGRQKGERWSRDAIWGNVPRAYKATFGNVDNVTSADFLAMWQQRLEREQRRQRALSPGTETPAQTTTSGAPIPASLTSSDITPLPSTVGMSIEPPQGRGNVETATFPSANMARSIKPNAMQHAMDDPRSQDDYEVRNASAASVERQLRQEAITEDQHAATKKVANDNAALEITNKLGELEHNSSRPADYLGLLKEIDANNDLDWKTKHELWGWVEASSGGKVARTWGIGYWDVFQAIQSGDITEESQLLQLVKPGGDGHLTPAGYKEAVKELRERRKPEGEAEAAAKKQFLEHVAKPQISSSNPELKIYSPKGEENFLKFMVMFNRLYERGRDAGLTTGQMLEPDSKEYLGKLIAPFKMTDADSLLDALKDKDAPPSWWGRRLQALGELDAAARAQIAPPPFDANNAVSKEDVAQAYRSGRITREEATKILMDRGWAKPAAPVPQVPISAPTPPLPPAPLFR